MKQDLKAANSFYNAFIKSLKWSVPLLAAIILVVMIVISS